MLGFYCLNALLRKCRISVELGITMSELSVVVYNFLVSVSRLLSVF